MVKRDEINRYIELASEPDSYLALLLSGFEGRFEDMVMNDEVYSITDMLEERDRKIVELEDEIEKLKKGNERLRDGIKRYLDLILNAGCNKIAVRGFVEDISKLLDELWRIKMGGRLFDDGDRGEIIKKEEMKK